MMQQKINMTKIMEEIDSPDPDDRHYIQRKADLDDRLYRMYDKIEETESQRFNVETVALISKVKE